MKTYTFHVVGMHCKACVALTESELKHLPEVRHVKADLTSLSVEVGGDFGDKLPEHIAADLSVILKSHGYTLSLDRPKHIPKWRDFSVAIPIAAIFIAIFILLQKLGVVNLISDGNVGYGTAFIVGLVASVSTCMAVVGGLVLSVSANFAKGGSKFRPMLYFHSARLVSFFILGGVIGALGSVFQLGATGSLVLGLIVAFVLLLLGINLLDIFPFMKKFQVSLPTFITKHIHGLKEVNHILTPALLGVVTFFLPCGFTQSMQLYTLTTGDFLAGGLTMFIFALGTLPILALLSFGFLGIHTKARSSIFFKSAGLVVIFFALFNLLNALVATGYISPLFNL